MKKQKNENSQNNPLQFKSTSGGIIMPDFKLFDRVTVIKASFLTPFTF